MELRFECPHCGQRISAAAGHIGIAAPCPHCGQSVSVPNPLSKVPETSPSVVRISPTPTAPRSSEPEPEFLRAQTTASEVRSPRKASPALKACLVLSVIFLVVLIATFVSYRPKSDAELAQNQYLWKTKYDPLLVNPSLIYGAGNGVPQGPGEAAIWYRGAAEHGDANAPFLLGAMYYGGFGVPENAGEAVKWYRKAADQGDVRAQSIVGSMYYAGNGVPKDVVLGYMYESLAAATKPELALFLKVFSLGMTREEVAEGQRLARKWTPTK